MVSGHLRGPAGDEGGEAVAETSAPRRGGPVRTVPRRRLRPQPGALGVPERGSVVGRGPLRRSEIPPSRRRTCGGVCPPVSGPDGASDSGGAGRGCGGAAATAAHDRPLACRADPSLGGGGAGSRGGALLRTPEENGSLPRAGFGLPRADSRRRPFPGPVGAVQGWSSGAPSSGYLRGDRGEMEGLNGEALPRDETVRALEAVLLVAAEPVSSTVLAQLVERDRTAVEASLANMADEYERVGSGIVLRNVAGGWRLYSH